MVDVWLGNMSVTRRRMFTRLKKADAGRLSAKIQELLHFRGLRRGSGNWGHILRMRLLRGKSGFHLTLGTLADHTIGKTLRPGRDTKYLEIHAQ